MARMVSAVINTGDLERPFYDPPSLSRLTKELPWGDLEYMSNSAQR